MHTYTVRSWSVNGEKRFRSCEARAIAGIANRKTWNNYRQSIGVEDILTMSDLIWVWVCKKWMGLNRRKTISTHQKFREIRWMENPDGSLKYGLDDFLDELDTDLLTITLEIRKAIKDGY